MGLSHPARELLKQFTLGGKRRNRSSLRARSGLTRKRFDQAVAELVSSGAVQRDGARLRRPAAPEILDGASEVAQAVYEHLPPGQWISGDRVAGLHGDPGQARRGLSELVAAGLVEAKRGRGGSYRRIEEAFAEEEDLIDPDRGAAPLLGELRLTSFKSFRDAELSLSDLTLIVGRNGSGKSNALDALEVLSRLATGEDIRDAIDRLLNGRQPVRGGAEGSAPMGRSSFAIGCSVMVLDRSYRLDVEVAVSPRVEIVQEQLIERRPGRADRELLVTTGPPGLDGGVDARFYSGRSGRNPTTRFMSSRLLTSQVPSLVPTTPKGGREVHDAAGVVLDSLRAVFVLDPVPHLMRQYVPGGDDALSRSGANVSAAVGTVLRDPEARETLLELLRALTDQGVLDIDVDRSRLNEVMLYVREKIDGHERDFSARLMSDGMLRFLAFVTALLQAPTIEESEEEPSRAPALRTLVIEEIENGLHPSQAARAVNLIREECGSRQIRVLATTHSPPLLSALSAREHAGVVVCDREPGTGVSRLRRLVDLPEYPLAMAQGSLGDVVTHDRLRSDAAPMMEDAVEALLASL